MNGVILIEQLLVGIRHRITVAREELMRLARSL